VRFYATSNERASKRNECSAMEQLVKWNEKKDPGPEVGKAFINRPDENDYSGVGEKGEGSRRTGMGRVARHSIDLTRLR